MTALHILENLNPFSENRKLQIYSVHVRFNTYVTAQAHHQRCLQNPALSYIFSLCVHVVQVCR